MADSANTAMPRVSRMPERKSAVRTLSRAEELAATEEALQTRMIQIRLEKQLEEQRLEQSKKFPLDSHAIQGEYQLWANTRQRRAQASGSIAMDIAKKMPDKSEMLTSNTMRDYTFRSGDTLQDVARGMKTRYGLAHNENEILQTLSEVNNIRDKSAVESGAKLDVASTLVRLNQLDLNRKPPVKKPAMIQRNQPVQAVVPSAPQFQLVAGSRFGL